MGKFEAQKNKHMHVLKLHVLKLIARDRDANGWATVSEVMCPIISQSVPSELTEFQKLEVGVERG